MKTKLFVILAVIISVSSVSSCSWIWRQSEALGNYLPVSSSVDRCKGNVYCGNRNGASPSSSNEMPSPMPAPSSTNYQQNYQQNYSDPYQNALTPPQPYQKQAGYPNPYQPQPAPQKSNFSYCPQCSQQMQPSGAIQEQQGQAPQMGKINMENPY